MSLFAVWFFVRIYCPMSYSISLSDFLSEFFLPLLVWFFVLFFVRICEMPYSISLSDYLVRFFVRFFVWFFCSIFCLTSCSILFPAILSEFICPISGWFFRLIFWPNLLSDVFMFDLFVWFFVRLYLLIFVRLLCSICFVRFFVSFFAQYFVRFVFPMSQPLICPWFFILMQVKLIFTRKFEYFGLILKVRVFGTRKWPIG